jgi:hypothetical protein
MLISFMFTWSVMKKYQMLICLLHLPLKAFQFCSSMIELSVLSCNNKFSMMPYPSPGLCSTVGNIYECVYFMLKLDNRLTSNTVDKSS